MSAILSYGLTTYAAEVNPWDLSQPLMCEYQYDEGEPARVGGPPDSWHPGYPPCVEITSCKLGGVELIDMLSSKQRETLEEAILELHE